MTEEFTLFGLAGKRALVVGGGQGMGESSATLLARAGCDVAVVDIEAARAERVATEVEKLGRRGVPLVFNVLDDAGGAAAVAEAEKQLGGLDVLVSIVGQALFVPLLEMSAEQWDSEQNRNLRYFFLVAKAAAASMKNRGTGGTMCCIASMDGIVGAPHHAAYGAAKAGLIHLVRSMASEWAPYNIRVNAVAPGSISTPRVPDTEAFRETMRQSLVPMGRSGTTDDIGKAVLFFVSEMSPYVTGQTLAVDGGWSASNIFDPRRYQVKSSVESAKK